MIGADAFIGDEVVELDRWLRDRSWCVVKFSQEWEFDGRRPFDEPKALRGTFELVICGPVTQTLPEYLAEELRKLGFVARDEFESVCTKEVGVPMARAWREVALSGRMMSRPTRGKVTH